MRSSSASRSAACSGLSWPGAFCRRRTGTCAHAGEETEPSPAAAAATTHQHVWCTPTCSALGLTRASTSLSSCSSSWGVFSLVHGAEEVAQKQGQQKQGRHC
jgi:hypothetical protein